MRGREVRGIASFACIALALVASSAHAQSERPEAPAVMLLVLAPCPSSGFEASELESRLRVELMGEGVSALRRVPHAEAAIDPSAGILHIAEEPCGGESATYVVRLDDLVTRKHVERSFELEGLESSARARALALASAELVRASWDELAVSDAPIDAPPSIVAATRMRIRVRGLREASLLTRPHEGEARPDELVMASHAVGAGLVVRGVPSGSLAPIGGEITFGIALSPEWRLRVGVESAYLRAGARLGEIEGGYLWLQLGLAYEVAIGSRVRIAIGPEVLGGAAWASGRAYDASTIARNAVAPVILLGATASLSVDVLRELALYTRLDASIAVANFDLRDTDLRIAGLVEGVLGMALGVEYRFE